MTSLQENLASIFERDLDILKNEILAYQIEDEMWEIRGEIKNSAGNLCLHLIGNLNHFIGAILGKSGYIRQREAEFESKNIPRDNMLVEIEETKKIVRNTIVNLSNDELNAEYPEDKFHKPVSVQYLLIHLISHLAYHVGQINYHRRI